MKRIALIYILLFVVARGWAQSIDEELAAFIASKAHPESVSDFKALPHLSSLNQDTTLICWSFATSSFIESEMKRLGMEPVRLSVVYPMYCVFLEKAKRFVETKGSSRLSPGDLFSGVLDIVAKYGTMPAASFEGMKETGTVYSHSRMYDEISALMRKVKKEGAWDETAVLARVKEILRAYVGEPPVEFVFRGTKHTPRSFADAIVRLPWNEYLLVTSFRYAPFDRFIELNVPDNWGRQSNYFNVPLDEFYEAMKSGVEKGYSVAFDADISEPSYERTKRYAIIPPSDVHEDSIDQNTREVRFKDERTTDDHLMHIVAYKRFGNEDWFLVKDSWRTAFEGSNGGYMFFHESYMKLKALAFLVHRNAVPAIAAKAFHRN